MTHTEEQARHLRALKELVDLVADECTSAATQDDPDNDSVGSYGDGRSIPMTFGHVRRAQTAIAALSALPPSATADAQNPEDTAEQFIQAAIDSAPEPLRRLGEWLADKLDEDEWATADKLITGAAVVLSRATADTQNTGVPQLSADFLRSLPGGTIDDAAYGQIEDALDRLEAPATEGGRWLKLHERIKKLTRPAPDAALEALKEAQERLRFVEGHLRNSEFSDLHAIGKDCGRSADGIDAVLRAAKTGGQS